MPSILVKFVKISYIDKMILRKLKEICILSNTWSCCKQDIKGKQTEHQSVRTGSRYGFTNKNGVNIIGTNSSRDQWCSYPQVL